MAQIGWIKLYRKMQECALWDDPEPFDRRSAWIDLLLLANHEDKTTVFDGKKVTVLRGQRITSVRALAGRWHWGNAKTLKFLRLLEELEMIERESDSSRTLITIVNYGVYQGCENADGTETEHKRNADGTLIDTDPERKSTTNKNIKNDKEVKNEKNEKEKTLSTLNVSDAETVPPVEKPDFPSQTVTAKKPTAYEQGVEVLEKQMSRTMLSPVVKDELRKYLLYRKQIKKVISATITINNLVAKVEEVAMKYGDTLVLEQFEKTFQNGWQGVFLAENDLKRTVNENRAGKRYSGGQPKYDWSKL